MARNVEFDEARAIQKAMEVFWKKGYSGASMRDLTDAMQISASSIYNTIGDKHQLFVRCISDYIHVRMDEALKHSAKIKSPLKAIVALINGCVTTILYSDNHCLAIKTTFEVASTDTQVQQIIKADNDFTYNLLISLVERAIEKGEIKVSQDAAMLTDYIINHFTGWHESFIIHKDKTRIKHMAAFLIKQISQ